MNTYVKHLSPSGNAKDASGRVWLVQEQPRTFRFPYAGWNKGGADTTKAETLEASITAFGLVAYEAPAAVKKYKTLSALDFGLKLTALGKLDQFLAIKATLPPATQFLVDRFTEIEYTNELTQQLIPVFKAGMGMTDADIEALFM